MRVGVDIMTVGGLGLSPCQLLDWAHGLGLEGVQFGGLRRLSPTLDVDQLSRVKAHADRLGMYTHVSVAQANPIVAEGGLDALERRLREEIEAAAGAGWRELHSFINNDQQRYEHPVPWKAHVDGCAELLCRLRPLLERLGSRVNLETHGETTFDLLRVIAKAGPQAAGICLDMANTLVNAEDPVLAARRAAPYTHLTHAKDAIVAFCPEGLVRQGRPPGQGVVDFRAILPVLAEHCPDLPLSIEDHKWLFTAKIFDRDWVDRNPDLTAHEMGQVVRLACGVQSRLHAGELPPLEEYEATPFMEEMETRLRSGRAYLAGLLSELGLQSPPLAAAAAAKEK